MKALNLKRLPMKAAPMRVIIPDHGTIYLRVHYDRNSRLFLGRTSCWR